MIVDSDYVLVLDRYVLSKEEIKAIIERGQCNSGKYLCEKCGFWHWTRYGVGKKHAKYLQKFKCRCGIYDRGIKCTNSNELKSVKRLWEMMNDMIRMYTVVKAMEYIDSWLRGAVLSVVVTKGIFDRGVMIEKIVDDRSKVKPIIFGNDVVFSIKLNEAEIIDVEMNEFNVGVIDEYKKLSDEEKKRIDMMAKAARISYWGVVKHELLEDKNPYIDVVTFMKLRDK